MPPITTVPVSSDPFFGRLAGPAEVHALVIAWSAEQAHRVGEIAVLPAGQLQVLGRGDEPSDEPRVRFVQQRPARFEPGEALTGAGLSRRQLLVEATDDGLRVESVGRCPMRVGPARRVQATLLPGETIVLRKQLVLLYLRRVAVFPRPSLFPVASWRAFGEPDAYGIVGESAATWVLREQLAFAAKSATHVLLVGESGTGKELAARAIAAMSDRRGKPLVARNAATFPPGIIDAELFGNAKNYPNAGMPERTGLLGQADGGLLFLDEIAELPHEQQAHLLRALDAGGEYQRLGESAMRRSDFRLVAATNRDPSVLKHDLRARLASTIELSPLAQRREDIPLLARQIVLRAAATSAAAAGRFVAAGPDGCAHARLSAGFIEGALQRDLPGNARDLEAAIWEAMSEAEGDEIGPPARWASQSAAGGASRGASGVAARTPLEPSESQIREALASAGGSVQNAARALRLPSRFKLYRLMKKHGIGEPSAT